MAAHQLRGQSGYGTNAGSFKARTHTAPGASAALVAPAPSHRHNAYDDLADEARMADDYAARGGSQAERAAALRDANLVQLAHR